MPKYLLGKMTVAVYELEALTRKDAESDLVKYQQQQMMSGEDAKKPEGLKYTTYKLGWFEVPEIDPTQGRNKILAEFLNLMKNVIPRVFEGGRIITLDQVDGPLKKNSGPL
jgi:hypothetical protein